LTPSDWKKASNAWARLSLQVRSVVLWAVHIWAAYSVQLEAVLRAARLDQAPWFARALEACLELRLVVMSGEF